MLNAGHLARGDNLRTVRPEYRPSAVAALKLLQREDFEQSYWLQMIEVIEDDEPRR